VGGVERVCKGEPGTECFVIRRLDAYIMSFECCRSSKEKEYKEVRCWVNLLMTARDLTCKIIFLWHVILCEERTLEVVHKEESEDGNREVSDDWRRHFQNKNLLRLSEGCCSEY
jgi:hypothetical protein